MEWSRRANGWRCATSGKERLVDGIFDVPRSPLTSRRILRNRPQSWRQFGDASRYRSPHVDHANHSERSTAEGWILRARRNGASIATTDSTVMAIAPATSGMIEVLLVP